jgi:hypothetical protein
MKNKLMKKAVWVLVGLSFASVSLCTDAFAREWQGQDHDRRVAVDRHRDQVVVFGHDRYRYHDGRFFHPSLFGLVFGTRAPFGVVITALPFGYQTTVAGGIRYYSYANVYYRDCASGYVVVPAPAAMNFAAVPVTNSYTAGGESIVVNVPNANGSYTPVRLVRSGDGYIGPQGEYYPGNPTVDQLRALYGR